MNFVNHGIGIVSMVLNESLLNFQITRIACDVRGNSQIGKHTQGLQSAFDPPVWMMVQIFGAIGTPASDGSGVVHQLEIMENEVIHQGGYDLSDRHFFVIRLSDQIIIQGVEKEVTIELIGAGITFPIPLSIRTDRPSWLIDLPEGVPFLGKALVPFKSTVIGIWQGR